MNPTVFDANYKIYIKNPEIKSILMELLNECKDDTIHKKLIHKVIERYGDKIAENDGIEYRKIIIEFFSKYDSKKCLKTFLISKLNKVANNVHLFDRIIADTVIEIVDVMNTQHKLRPKQCLQLLNVVCHYMQSFKSKIEYELLVYQVFPLYVPIYRAFSTLLKENERLNFVKNDDVLSMIDEILKQILIIFAKIKAPILMKYSTELVQLNYKLMTYEGTKYELRAKSALVVARCLSALPPEEMNYIKHKNFPILDIIANMDSEKCLLLKTIKLENCFQHDELNKILIYYAAINCEATNIANITFQNKPLIHFICNGLLDSATKVTGCPSHIMAVSRTLLTISEILKNVTNPISEELYTKCLVYIWSHLNHFIDTVRHTTRDFLSQMVQYGVHIYKTADNISFLNLTIDQIKSMCPLDNIRLIALEVVCEHVDTNYLLSRFEGLQKFLLNCINDAHSATTAGNVYMFLMSKQIEQISKEKFISIWIDPVSKMLRSPFGVPSQVYEQIVTHAFQCMPSIFRIIFPTNQIGTKAEWLTQLRCLHYARTKGITIPLESNENHALYWRGLICKRKLELCMVHQDEDIRLSTLRTIVECQKSTEELNEWEIFFLVSYYSYNVAAQIPSTRHRIGSLYKKVFLRFQASYSVLQKKIRNGQKQLLLQRDNRDPTLAHNVKQFECKLYFYRVFLIQFITLLQAGLGPDSNYPRRSLSLDLLLVISTVAAPYDWRNSFSHNDAKNLTTLFFDNYETNKYKALLLVKTLPATLFGFPDEKSARSFFEFCVATACDVKPNKCLSAPYLFEVSLFTSSNFLQQQHGHNKVDVRLRLLKTLVEHLTTLFDKKAKNASDYNIPVSLYGLLASIRTVVAHRELSTKEKDYTTYFRKLVQLCLKVKQLMPIIYSQAPEGDSEDFTNDLVFEFSDMDITHLALIYAWRTLKEAMHLLAELVSQTIKHQSTTILLTEENLMDIGEFFIDIFRRSRHRGVFEQAYAAFYIICCSFWKSANEKISSLPLIWLNDVIDICSGNKQDDKLCVTRRSAGLPFLTVAIISSETLASKASYHIVIEALLRTLEDQSDDRNQKQHIHALNILRSVFTAAKLNESVVKYIGKAFIISIKGFQSKIWGIRNSSTLLFSALMTRMFGVQRTSDSEYPPMKNRMTVTTFCLRYPELFKFLLRTLEDECCKRNSMMLYPTLLIMARLCPSYCDKSNVLLEQYFPYICKCLTNPIYRTRELAGRASVTFISTDLIPKHLQVSFSRLSANDIKDNECHGLLLQIWYILKNNKFPQLLPITEYITKSIHILDGLHKHFSHMTVSIYMEIVIMLLLKFKDYNDVKTLKQLLKHLTRMRIDGYDLNTWRTKFKWTHLELIMIIVLNKFERIDATYMGMTCQLVDFLFNPVLETRLLCLHFLIYLNQISTLLTYSTHPLLAMGVFEISESVQQLVDSFDHQSRVGILRSMHPFIVRMLQMDINENLSFEYAIPMFILLRHYPCVIRNFNRTLQGNLDFLLAFCTCDNEEVVTVALICINTLLMKATSKELSRLNFRTLINALGQSASPAAADYRRLSVAQLLVNISQMFYGESFLKEIDLCSMLNIVMVLLEDEELIVRNTISTFKALNCAINTRNVLMCNLVPDKIRADLLSRSTRLLSHDRAICFLFSWSARHLPQVSDDMLEIFDRGESNQYAENVSIIYSAIKVLNGLVWPLVCGLSYDDNSIFLEEQALLVTTVVLDALVKYPSPMMLSNTKTSAICALKSIIRFIESHTVGNDFKKEFNTFFNDTILKYLFTTAKIDYWSLSTVMTKLYVNILNKE